MLVNKWKISKREETETQLCAAVDTAGHQHGLEKMCSVCGVPGVHQDVISSAKPVCTKLAGKTCLIFPFDAPVCIFRNHVR
jgi:hypothetical protein